MDFAPQHVVELIQDPLVLVLILIGLLIGVVLGRIGSRRRAKAPLHSDNRPTNTPPRQMDNVSGHGTRAGSSAQGSTPKPAVPETPQPAPTLPDPVPVTPAQASAMVHGRPEPARTPLPVPEIADPSPSTGLEAEVRIHTRTGTNPSTVKLIDPHAESERVWSEAETVRAVALYRSDKSVFQIARAVGIDQIQVATHLIRELFHFHGVMNDLGSAPRNGKSYTDEEISKMKSYFDAGVQLQDIAAAVERTVLGVGWRMLDRRMI